MLSFHAKEIDPFHILYDEWRPHVVFVVSDFNVAELYVAGMANEEAVAGHDRAKHGWFGVGILILGGLSSSILLRAASLVLDIDIAQPDIFDFVTWNAADDRAQP